MRLYKTPNGRRNARRNRDTPPKIHVAEVSRQATYRVSLLQHHVTAAASDPTQQDTDCCIVAWRQRWSVTPIKREMSVDQDPINAPPQTTICSVGARLLRPGGAEAKLLNPGFFLVHLVLPSHHRKVGFLRAQVAESAECIVCTAFALHL